MKDSTCCFTGHRPNSLPCKYDESHKHCLIIKEQLNKQIRLAIESGYTTFLSGMAVGADIWAAEAVISLKTEFPQISLVAILPFANQASRWGANLKARYDEIISNCDDVVSLQQDYSKGCMHIRNKELVDRSSRVIAVYDGRETGGTAYTVSLAMKKRLDVFFINSREPEVLTTPFLGSEFNLP